MWYGFTVILTVGNAAPGVPQIFIIYYLFFIIYYLTTQPIIPLHALDKR